MKGAPWTAEENAKLAEAFDAGATIDELVASHERTGNAIVTQLVRLRRLTEHRGAYHRTTPWATFKKIKELGQ